MIFTGCVAKNERDLINNMSESRQFIFVQEVDNFSVSLVCGAREEKYVYDGVATPLKDFGVITIKIPKDSDLKNKDVEFILNVGDKTYSGIFEHNPFDESLVADIGEIVEKKDEVTLNIKSIDFEKQFKLSLVSDKWEVSYLDVIDIVVKNYKKELKSFYKDNVFCGEVYVKIKEGENGDKNYYWYFNLISPDGNSISSIISPLTGEILASKSSINSLK